MIIFKKHIHNSIVLHRHTIPIHIIPVRKVRIIRVIGEVRIIRVIVRESIENNKI